MRHIFARKLGPFFRAEERVDEDIELKLPRSFFGGGLSRMCCCNTKYDSCRGGGVLNTSLITRFGAPVRIRDSLLTTTHNLFGYRTKVTYVLNAKSGSYFCSNGVVIGGIGTTKCVLKSRNDKTILKGLFLTSLLGKLTPGRLTGRFRRGFHVSIGSIVRSMCGLPFPGHFLKAVTCFLKSCVSGRCMCGLLAGGLHDFFGHGMYRCSCVGCPVHFMNSLTCTCPSVLRRMTRRFKMRVSIVRRAPVGNLVRFRSVGVRRSWGHTRCLGGISGPWRPSLVGMFASRFCGARGRRGIGVRVWVWVVWGVYS